MDVEEFIMKFLPEKAKIVNGLFFIVITSIVVMFIILKKSENILTKSLMFILIGTSIVVGGLFLAFLKTLYYEIKDDTLRICSMFSYEDVKIPLDEIKYYTERITLINQTGLAGLISKRFSLSSGYIEGMGKVNMYITNSKKSIFLVTEDGNYAVSPSDIVLFSNELKKHGIKEEYIEREVLEKDVLKSRNMLRQYFLLNAVMVLILVITPIALFYLKKLPEYILLNQINSGILNYIPTSIYIDRMISHAVIVFILSMVFYGLALVYAKSNKIYFYRIMIIPLILTFLQLLSLANKLIAIFF